MSGFYALRFVSVFLRTVGWITAIVGILAIILPYIPENIYEFAREFDDLGLYQMAKLNSTKFLTYGLGLFSGGILVAGFGDLFRVFLAIADNTRGRAIMASRSPTK